jgi:hypothetical protein
MLTLVQIQKSDADLATIFALNKYIKTLHGLLVLSGGYATEALCDGEITRPHGDMDVHISISTDQNIDDLYSGIQKLLSKEKTNWTIGKKSETKIVFIEKASTISDFDKRELEITLHKEKSKPKFTEVFLVNSKREKIKVLVVNLHELLASKVHNIYSTKVGDVILGRKTKQNDINDLKRLMNLPNYNKEELLETLASRYVKAEIGINNYDEAQNEALFVESFLKT